MSPADQDRLQRIIDEHRGQRWGLIPLLQQVQEEFGYIPEEGIRRTVDWMREHYGME